MLPDLGWLIEIYVELEKRREDHSPDRLGYFGDVKIALDALFTALWLHTRNLTVESPPNSDGSDSQCWVVRIRERLAAYSKNYPSYKGNAFSIADTALRRLSEALRAHVAEDAAHKKQRDFQRGRVRREGTKEGTHQSALLV